MDERTFMAERFEAQRSQLTAIAYRMLGSASEADDALQEAWLRISRADTTDVDNLGGWLTTVVARVCLNMLRSRRSRREEWLDPHVADPVVTHEGTADPEHQTLVADSVGLALQVVLDTLKPAERLAFVLHDMFAVPFDEIAPIVDRTPEAARQLASRARRRVQTAAVPDTNLAHQRQVVDAFFAAARSGDFDALVAVLDPDVVLRSDRGSRAGEALVFRGATTVASQALMFADPSRLLVPAVVNGMAGVVVILEGRPVAVMAFTVSVGRIVAIDSLADPHRVSGIDYGALEERFFE